jgi:hypothetical protein
LADAEERAPVAAAAAVDPSPEQEIDAVLPAELLAALDEPLEDDERDAELGVPSRAPSVMPGRDRTNDGASPRTTGASATGSGATPRGTGATGPGTGDEPLTPSPQPPAPVASARSSDDADWSRPRLDASEPDEQAPRHEPLMHAGAASVLTEASQVMRLVARAIAERTSGTLCLAGEEAERRAILREGDIVTCASTSESESLLAFLGVRGDLPRETVRRLGPRFPAFGRHAAAALVARGYLRQDQMWATLRAHSEWVLGRIFQSATVRAVVEARPPGRLGSEPSVFGGATGAAVFVEVVRRVVAPEDALEQMGGGRSRIGLGPASDLLVECALPPAEVELVRRATGSKLDDILEEAPDRDFATAVLALAHLGVVDVLRAADQHDSLDEESPNLALLDAEAVRESVRARLHLVEDGDYFALLGVARDATGYDVRRAFLELRRAFEPSRLLSPELADLAEDVRTISSVLEEAYEILKDPARRERYRRAIEGQPDA